MRLLIKIFALMLLCAFAGALSAADSTCEGKFPNPITDVCWKCIFPIKLGSITVAELGQDDGDNDEAPLICACPAPPPLFVSIGLGISYWEPARVAENVREPFCFPTLGGITLADLGPLISDGDVKTDDSGEPNGFMQTHWMLFPLFNWMSFLTSTTCATTEGFDVMAMTEFDPTWSNDSLGALFSPEAIIFANPIAEAACAADCVAASTSKGPLNKLFWCSGCNGGVFPLTGNVTNGSSALEVSLMSVQKLHTKLHRSTLSLDYASRSAMCGPKTNVLIKKSAYKTQMLYPRPYTKRAQFYGSTITPWGSGRQYPIKGEDFSFLIFRRRTCCATLY